MNGSLVPLLICLFSNFDISKTFIVICYSDPFYGPYYLLHHVWTQVGQLFVSITIVAQISIPIHFIAFGKSTIFEVIIIVDIQAVVVTAVSKAFSFLLARFFTFLDSS